MSGLDIDTRSDIYSLGILLYELLVGQPPFNPKTLLSLGYDEMLRFIKEEEPPKPSTKLTDTQNQLEGRHHEISAGSLRGDLDWIVMKAIEKDRTRRYETVNALSEDILRHLNDEPVLAAAPGAGYRIRKFVCRNRSAVAAASVISILLVAGITVSSWLAIVAKRLQEDETRAKNALAHQLMITEKAQQEAENRTLESHYSLAKVFEEKAESAILEARHEGHYSESDLSKAWLYSLSALEIGIGPGHDMPVAQAQLLMPELRTTDGRELWHSSSAEGQVNNVAYSPDGKSIATAAGRVIQLWSTETGEQTGRFVGHSHDVRSIAFSPASTQLLSGSTDSTMRLWDISSQQETAQFLGHTDAVNSVAFSPDGNGVLSASDDGTARIWAIATGDETVRFAGHFPLSVRSVAFSPHGDSVLSGSDDGTMRLWSVSTKQEIGQPMSHKGPVRSVAFSSDGTKALSGSADEIVRWWDLTSRQELAHLGGHEGIVWSAIFSPDGKRALSSSGTGTLQLWDLESQEEIGRLVGHITRVSGVAFAPDGTKALSGSEDGTVSLWDTTTKREIANFSGHSGRVWDVAFSPDGSKAFSASNDGTLRAWDTTTGIEIARLFAHQGRYQLCCDQPRRQQGCDWIRRQPGDRVEPRHPHGNRPI
ncbi:MAG: hypothetical protein KDN22_01210 [Verrucomicrobiae bacterium]|nr:hypothetical protein [Verrucomicrobiae bacterium]